METEKGKTETQFPKDYKQVTRPFFNKRPRFFFFFFFFDIYIKEQREHVHRHRFMQHEHIP